MWRAYAAGLAPPRAEDGLEVAALALPERQLHCVGLRRLFRSDAERPHRLKIGQLSRLNRRCVGRRNLDGKGAGGHVGAVERNEDVLGCRRARVQTQPRLFRRGQWVDVSETELQS